MQETCGRGNWGNEFSVPEALETQATGTEATAYLAGVVVTAARADPCLLKGRHLPRESIRGMLMLETNHHRRAGLCHRRGPNRGKATSTSTSSQIPLESLPDVLYFRRRHNSSPDLDDQICGMLMCFSRGANMSSRSQ